MINQLYEPVRDETERALLDEILEAIDGDVIPPRVLAAAVANARVLDMTAVVPEDN